jgi:phenylacetate-CoA ligase
MQGGPSSAELLIVELLDETNKAVSSRPGGEVTITTLGVEGMPLLRYKTGDICVYDDRPCACGRNTLRLSPIVGRKKQMIKYKGTTLYPPALFDILNEMEDVIDL